MSSLSQALRLGVLPPPHSTFQGHATHIIEWSMMLRPNDSWGTCIPQGITTFLHYASRRGAGWRYMIVTMDVLLTQRRLAHQIEQTGATTSCRSKTTSGRSSAKKTGEVRQEEVEGATSLAPEHVDAAHLLSLVRGQWQIENKSCGVRDVTFDADRRCGLAISHRGWWHCATRSSDWCGGQGTQTLRRSTAGLLPSQR